LAGENPIPLSKAPSRFFADDWARLTSLKGGPAEALKALDSPDHLAYYRSQILEQNLGTQQFRMELVAEEEAYMLVDRVHEGMRALGFEGRIAASGLFVGTGRREVVPAELWPTAKIAFGAERVASNDFIFHYVTVEPAAATADIQSVASAMSAWLGGRRAERGDEAKKVLQDAARERFGETFRVQIFNTAYADCYGRSRGRPPKRKN
jgi:hypothetical protein